jgi:hypothetical protein
MVLRSSFAIQYLCMACVFVTYSMAIAFPTVLQGFYESATLLLGVERGWVAPFDIESTGFPQAAAHSVITALSLVTAYIIGLLRAHNYLNCQLTWEAQDISNLTERLRSIFISNILVLPLASYVSANSARLFAPLVLKSPNPKKTTVAAAWLGYFFSKAVLSIAAFEILLPAALLVFAEASSRDSVGSLRYFTINTLMIWFICSLGFKLCLTAIALLHVYLKGENSHGDG